MIRIYFDNVLINEDGYAELTNEYELFNNSFYLGSVASNTFKLKVLKSLVSSHPTNVKIDDDITTFHLIVDKVEEDKGFYNYTFVDKMVNFNFNYDAKPLIDEKLALEEDCYLSDILEDMCLKAGVELDYILTNDIIVSWHDSRIQAREYLSFIAELEGGYACINELGKLTIKQHKQASKKTILIDEVSELIIGEKKKITRVVYDNGLVKYEFGDDTGNTLYLNQNNTFITDEIVVENIYNKIVDFEFYTITVPNVLIDSSIKAGDVITFVDGENEYPTIAQYSSSYAGGWVGSYEFNINTNKQEETKILGIEESVLSIKTEVDRTNASLKITSEKTDENTSKIVSMETDINGFNEKIEDVKYYTDEIGNKKLVSESVFDLNKTINGIEFAITKTGNNILKGTQFYDLGEWGIELGKSYIESSTPPESVPTGFFWYCTQDNGEYINGKIYIYTGSEWNLTSQTRKDLDNQEDLIQNFSIVENDETRKNALSQRYGRLISNQGQTPLTLSTIVHKLENVNLEQDYVTLSYKIKNNMEYGEAGLFVDLLNKDITMLDDINTCIVWENYNLIYKGTGNGLYTMRVPIIKQSNTITGVSGEMPPENNNLGWLYSDNGIYGMLMTFDGENWIPDARQLNFYDGTDYWCFYSSNYMKSPISLNEGNKITLGSIIDISYVSDVSEDEPIPMPNSLWANPVTDELKIPIFEDGEFKEWQLIELTFTDAVNNYTLYPQLGAPFIFPKGQLEFYDCKLEYGDYSEWSPNPNEFYGRNFAINDRGFYIKKGNNQMFIDEDEIEATYKNETIFSIDGEEIYGKKLKSLETDIDGEISKAITVGTRKIHIKYVR